MSLDGPHEDPEGAGRRRSISRYVFFGFAAIAVYLLITEHWTHITEHWGHIANVLPFVLLAACPLLHLFHHSGHGHADEESPSSRPAGPGGPSDAVGGGHRH
jgi:peptidoglycan/LPS O-acetylase OafA/YrhL